MIILHLLEKAGQNKADAGIVGAKADVVAALIRLWLCTAETAVAKHAFDLLLSLLRADEAQLQTEPCYHSLMWRRVFRDRDIYGSIFSICSLTTAGEEGSLSKRSKTVAQARLLDLLAEINCEPVRSSQFPDIEAKYGVKRGGMLEFAAVRMVDYPNDILMHETLIHFFANLLRSLAALDFLIENGLHEHTISYYIEPEKHSSLDVAFVYSRSANYIAVYGSRFGAHLLSQRSVLKSILLRLSNVLKEQSLSRQVQIPSLIHDLHVLVSLPRLALLPQNFDDSPIFLLRTNFGDADIYKALAAVFRGYDEPYPVRGGFESGNQLVESEENSAARALYFLYLKKFPGFWRQTVQAAETLALKDVALAAILLIESVISANWHPLPTQPIETSQDSIALPTEEELTARCNSVGQTLPPSGISAILTSPALEIVAPYLLRPAQTFGNLVGGSGDSESAAYKVAVAKYDVMVLFHHKLKVLMRNPDPSTGKFIGIVSAAEKRVAQGPLGGITEIGGRIGTLEL